MNDHLAVTMRTTDKQLNAGRELVADLLSKLTPGPWASNTPPSSTFTHRFIVAERETGHSPVLAEVGGRMTSDDEVSIFQSVANARAMAATVEVLKAAAFAYLALLRTGVSYRMGVQSKLSALRDYIANATGRDSRDIQDAFEATLHAR